MEKRILPKVETRVGFRTMIMQKSKIKSDRKIIVFQPALPEYRVDFFKRLSDYFGSNFRLYYSPTDMGVLTNINTAYHWAKAVGSMRSLLPGFKNIIEWQRGVTDVNISRGDIVIFCGGPRTISTLYLIIKARFYGAKTIWFGHYWSSTTKYYRFYIRMILMKMVHAVLFYTDQEIIDYRKGFGRNDIRPISAVNNGINVEKIENLYLPFNANSRPLEILFIGRLTEKAQVDLLLQAMADHRLNDVILNVIGDGPEKHSLLNRSKELGLVDRINWHGGSVDENFISEVANRCRMFVYPGAVGLSLIHAMAYGLPCLINDDRWGNNPEISAFENNETGQAFARDDVFNLADRLNGMIRDAASLNRWSQAALKRAHEQFNTRAMSDRVKELVYKLENS